MEKLIMRGKLCENKKIKIETNIILCTDCCYLKHYALSQRTNITDISNTFCKQLFTTPVYFLCFIIYCELFLVQI